MNKKRLVKVLSVVLALIMVLSLSPRMVFADDIPLGSGRGERDTDLFEPDEALEPETAGEPGLEQYETVQQGSLIKRSAIGYNWEWDIGFYFWEDIRDSDAYEFLLESDIGFNGGGFLPSPTEGHILHLLTYDFRYFRFDTKTHTLEEVKRFEMENKLVVDMTPYMTIYGPLFIGLGYDRAKVQDFLFGFAPQDGSLTVFHEFPGPSVMNAIAHVPKEDRLYLLDATNNKLFTMHLSNRILWEVGDLGYDSNWEAIQSIDYDEMNDTLFWVSRPYSSDEQNKLWTIDRETGKASLVGEIGPGKFTVFALMPPERIHFPMVLKPSAILNGDFENGNAGWKEETEDGSPLIIPDWQVFGAPKAHSGEKYLLFSNETEGIQSVSQTITLPHNADLLTYWDYVYAVGEPTTPEKITIYINGEVLFTGGLHNTLEWNLIDHLSLADYAGQTVEFKVEFISDGSRTIFFFLDDFVVTTRDD